MSSYLMRYFVLYELNTLDACWIVVDVWSDRIDAESFRCNWVLVFLQFRNLLCDVLGLTDIEECSLNLHLADSTIKKPMGRINDVLILANRNYVRIK